MLSTIIKKMNYQKLGKQSKEGKFSIHKSDSFSLFHFSYFVNFLRRNELISIDNDQIYTVRLL